MLKARKPAPQRTWRSVAIGTLAILMLSACGGGDETAGTDGTEEGQENGTATPAAEDANGDGGELLRVGSTLELAPNEFVNEDGEPVGFEVEVVEEAASRMGYDVEWVKTPFEQAFSGLQAERYRFNASSIFVTCERVSNSEEFGVFAKPFFEASQLLTTREELASEIQSVEDLEGRSLGVESAGSTADGIAEEWLNEDGMNFDKQTFPDTEGLFLALSQGRVDAALQSTAVTRWAIQDRDNVVEVTVIEGSQIPNAVIFRQGDPMREEFNSVVAEMKEEGVVKDIYVKWFDAEPSPDGPEVNDVPTPTKEAACDE